MNFNQEDDFQVIPEVETIIEKLQQENEELKDKYLRSSAELNNFRKRTIREKAELVKTAGEKTILEILPIMDDLDRASQEIEKVTSIEEALACIEGYIVISNKLQSTLMNLGVEKINPVGEDFDPEFHEAIALGDGPQGKVLECIQPGYSLGGKIIRFAKVIVGQ